MTFWVGEVIKTPTIGREAGETLRWQLAIGSPETNV